MQARMQTSPESHTSVLQAMQASWLGVELAIHGTANPSSFPWCSVRAFTQSSPVWLHGWVCALSQTTEAEGEGDSHAIRASGSVTDCSCVFPQVNFKTSPNSSSSSEEPCTPATCIMLRPLWVRRSWKRTGDRILSLSQSLCRLHSGNLPSPHLDLNFILTIVELWVLQQAGPLYPGCFLTWLRVKVKKTRSKGNQNPVQTGHP